MKGVDNFTFYSDAGHGWLAVKRQLLESLGIIKSISSYSYERGDMVYLEEDCDMRRFKVAMEKVGKGDLRITTKSSNRSAIRNYSSFKY